MASTENSIFREVASMAGDIVFRYDFLTGKFMQYSDKMEVSKYGSWIFDINNIMDDNTVIYDEDKERVKELLRSIQNGVSGNIEGVFRMRIHSGSDYRWHHLLARVRFQGSKAVEVIGRITDIHLYMTSQRMQPMSAAGSGGYIGMSDRDMIMDSITNFRRQHKDNAAATCILFSIPAYDDVIRCLSGSDSQEFMHNLVHRIRGNFPQETVVGKIGINSFAVFTGEINTPAEVGDCVARVRQSILELGTRYSEALQGRTLDMNTGIAIDKNGEGVETVIFDKAHKALCQAESKGVGYTVFFKDEEEKNKPVQAQNSFDAGDMFAQYALGMLNVSLNTHGNSTEHIQSCINKLAEKLCVKYGFERICVSVCKAGEYKEYTQWHISDLDGLPEGAFLHICGAKGDIEQKVNFWEPYVVNDVYMYPDDSRYGRIVGTTAVRSFMQTGFECSNGIRGIVSVEYYSKPHFWTSEELGVLDISKYVAVYLMLPTRQ